MVSTSLKIEQLEHSFNKKRMLSNINLSVKKGEILCLLGPSGCGKSTLLRLIAGLEPLQTGTITLNHTQITPKSQNLKENPVGLMFQDFALFPHLSVLKNVLFGLRKEKNALETAQYCLKLVGMEEYEKAMPHQLSGGQQQRVALARALAPKPEILLLDEPFSGLDQAHREQLRDDCLHILKEAGVTTVLVTHSPEEAMFMADHIALMQKGTIIQVGKPDSLYFNPASPFVVRFFGEINEIKGTFKAGQAATTLGDLKPSSWLFCKDLPYKEGDFLRVLIRPEALRLCRFDQVNSGMPIGKVMATRILGRSSMIHLSVKQDQGEDLHLHARVSGLFTPKKGEHLGIGIDPDLSFAFAEK